MIYVLVAIVASAISFLITRIWYTKKISAIVRSHDYDMSAEFSATFRSGWDNGIEYGKRQGRLEMIEKFKK